MSAAPFEIRCCPKLPKGSSDTVRRWAVFRLSSDSETCVLRRISPMYSGASAKRRARAFLDGVLLCWFDAIKRNAGNANAATASNATVDAAQQ